jgi:hypothetical protein
MFWGTRGNTIVSGDFIGSTNSSGTLPLEFKVNNITRLTIPTNAVSGYITASNIVGFKAPASSVPATSVYSIGSSFEFGLSGNPGTSGYTALRFGTTSFLTGLNTVGVGISIAGNPTPTEVLDVDGNIFTRDKIIYQKNSVNSVEKTGKIERYWSGPIFTSGNSAYFYNESPSTNDIRFRVRRDAGGNYFFQVATSGTRSGDYNCDGINKLLPNNIATYTDVVLAVTGPDATKTFLIKKRLNTGDPTYRITMIITDQYCDVVIEAWFH